MKNRKNRRKLKSKITYEKLKEIMSDENQTETLEKMMRDQDIPYELFYEVSRELRLNRLFYDLNVDEADLMKAKKKVIKLSPESTEYPLFSTLYRDHDGKYMVETLLNEYHDSTFREGVIIGMGYGKKFIFEDIQNNRFTKEDILNMSQEEIIKYCDENRDEV